VTSRAHRKAAGGVRGAASRAPLRGLLPLLLLLGVWQLVGDPNSFDYPPPSTWIEALGELLSEGELIPALLATMRTFAASLAIATVVGAALGAAIGASSRVEAALSPILEFLRALPPPAIVPLAVLLLGINSGTAIVIVAFASIWPVLLATAAAMRAISPIRLESARTLQLGWLDRIRKVILPSLAPGIALGFRVTAPITLIVTLLAEILASINGLGSLLIAGQRGFDTSQVFAILLVVGVLGLVVAVGVALSEGLIFRNWPPDRPAGTV
jgi:sulfonate transport system permease protein